VSDSPPEGEAAAEPPARESHLSIDAEPSKFPDDDAACAWLRKIDHWLGVAEQGLVFGLLALVVTVAAIAAIHDKLVTEHIGRWWHYIVRGGTFAVAMFAAVYATQQQRHLAMDLVSRRLSPRGRLILGLVLKALTIAIAYMLYKSGRAQIAVAGGTESLDLFGLHIVDADIVSTIFIGAALIIVHTALHFAIDASYLARGKLPPERARSGH
jgi:TRAP-type mannitol/chloroaromatic compound transport system permease small subunit